MKGILLVNLGSPESPSVKDVKKYLGEFLMDERVIDIPPFFRFLLVKGIIVNTRSKKSAKAYQSIWTKEGSPLIVNSEKLSKAISKKVNYPISLAMRYGAMSIEKGLEDLHNQGVNEVLLMPLYPQYAMSTTETVTVKAKEIQKEKFPEMYMEFLAPFYNRNEYIQTLVDSIKEVWDPNSFLLFSYHGLPERHLRKSDPTKSHCLASADCCSTDSLAHKTCYRHQSYSITKSVVSKLGLSEGSYMTSFQSRLGSDPWLQPYTDSSLIELAHSGKKNVQVVAPSFVSDCLETLEELEIENAENFKEAGGENFSYIACLNDSDRWVEVLKSWCDDWIEN